MMILINRKLISIFSWLKHYGMTSWHVPRQGESHEYLIGNGWKGQVLKWLI
jgi:hypothetical protein